jgi:hypothetical protein
MLTMVVLIQSSDRFVPLIEVSTPEQVLGRYSPG